MHMHTPSVIGGGLGPDFKIQGLPDVSKSFFPNIINEIRWQNLIGMTNLIKRAFNLMCLASWRTKAYPRSLSIREPHTDIPPCLLGFSAPSDRRVSNTGVGNWWGEEKPPQEA